VRILHLFSNWKWTGPAEPALNLAWRQGDEHEVRFASGTSSGEVPSHITPHAEARGVHVVSGFHLDKHANLGRNRADVARLTTLLDEFRPDIIHTHLPNDHRIGSTAVARTGIGKLIRTAYDADGLSGSLRTRRIVRRALDGLILTSRTCWDHTLARYGGSARSISVRGQPRPVALIEGGIDLTRFDPGRFDRPTERQRMGLESDHVAIGIVARVQGHRRFDMLLEALVAVHKRHPEVRLVVIGRGTHIKPLLLDPVAQLGLEGIVFSTGYLRGDEFPGALLALDVSLFLVPGSDGTCRALREQMAMGLPSIVTPRSPLPDIVEEGSSGLVVEESVEGLTAGIERMVGDASLRHRLARGAHDAARRRFDLKLQAREVGAFYEVVLGG
jgi:glycosyltransferase involved in cell wall biosynthesis